MRALVGVLIAAMTISTMNVPAIAEELGITADAQEQIIQDSTVNTENQSATAEGTPAEGTDATVNEGDDPADTSADAATDATADAQPADDQQPDEAAGTESDQNNLAGEGSSENDPAAVEEDTIAQVAVKVANASLKYTDANGAEQTVSENKDAVDFPTQTEIKFSVTANDGFQASRVFYTFDGVDTDVAADESGTYTIPAEAVNDGLAITVETAEIPAADEPAADDAAGEADGVATLTINVENSTVTLTNAEGEEQKVSESQDVEVAADEDLALAVEPAEDYELEGVTVTDADETSEVSGEDGVYTIPADQVIEGSNIQVSAVTAAKAQATRAATANMTVGGTQEVTCNSGDWRHSHDWQSNNPRVASVSTTDGWFGSQQGTQTVTAKNPGTANIYCGDTLILTVNVSAAKIAINFDLNGGRGTQPSSIEVEKSGEIISLPDGEGITRDGYELLGWSTEKDSNTVTNQAGQDAEKPPVYGLGSAFEATESDTLYAVWAQSSGTSSGKIAIAVRYDGVIPSEPSLNNDSYKYLREGYSVDNVLDYFKPAHTTVGTSAVEAALTDFFYIEVERINRTSGYEYWDPDTQYVEWYVIKYQGNDSTWHIDGVCRQISKVNLDYDGNYNTGGLVPRGGQHDKGDTVTVSQPGAYDYYDKWQEMVKSGYEFVGWLSSVDGKTYQPGDSITVNENTTLTAQWQLKNNVRINYEVAGGVGGTVTPSYENLNPDTGVAKGSTAIASEGYKFVGWYDNAKCEGEPLSEEGKYVPQKPAGEWTAATYYAKFEEEVGTVRYNLTLDGASWVGGTPSDMQLESGNFYAVKTHFSKGDTFTVTSDVPQCKGYVFVGWFDKDRTQTEGGQGATMRPAGGQLTYIYDDADNKYTLDALWVEVSAEGGSDTYDGTDHYITAGAELEGGGLTNDYLQEIEDAGLIEFGTMEYRYQKDEVDCQF